jgi:hypothetical protein
MSAQRIILAGATGHLGGRIARVLRERDIAVRAIVRPGSANNGLGAVRAWGVELAEAAYDDLDALVRACWGGSCVVSALNGLRDVILDAQTALLEAAVAADVPRFIPSDFAVDFTRLPEGSNRNCDLRREFQAPPRCRAHQSHLDPERHVHGPAHGSGAVHHLQAAPRRVLGECGSATGLHHHGRRRCLHCLGGHRRWNAARPSHRRRHTDRSPTIASRIERDG